MTFVLGDVRFVTGVMSVCGEEQEEIERLVNSTANN